ncbi:hypothetical protein C8R45DRAFT_447327 [Mycena sanguinolenta]|nr:hypothetical protein C8R45DRAFT_447327 [Mycena sanguinolenta]
MTPNSQGSLRVVLELNPFTRTSTRELLQSFPMISHLQLVTSERYDPGRISLDDEFMALFCFPHNLCPVLTDIKFCAPNAGFSDAAALAFIRARMARYTPLRRFHAEFTRPMEFDVVPELRSFISNGFQVNLEYPQSEWTFRARDGLKQQGHSILGFIEADGVETLQALR